MNKEQYLTDVKGLTQQEQVQIQTMADLVFKDISNPNITPEKTQEILYAGFTAMLVFSKNYQSRLEKERFYNALSQKH